MKYALLTYKESNNIGDYIQTLAAKQFLPRVDYYLDRDYLNKFTSTDGVKLICNGWFMHKPKNWPPSAKIIPLFTSFHLTNYKKASEILISKNLINYYKQHEPIGCRDYSTVNLFKTIGIKATFSGCLTLTLTNKNNINNPRDKYIFVDPFGARENYQFYLPGDKKFRTDLWEHIPSLVRNQSVFLTHKIPKNIFFPNHPSRYEQAEKLLDIYSQARLVVTSRLHCALPCLALGTPVIFVNTTNSSKSKELRYGGLIDLMHTCTLEDLENNSFIIDWENPEKYLCHKDRFIELRNSLIENSQQFINRDYYEINNG